MSYEGLMGPAEVEPDIHRSPAALRPLGEAEEVDSWETRVGVTRHSS